MKKMKKMIIIGFCVVSCGIWGCSQSSSLGSRLRGNTFQAEGINEILALLSDCSGGGSMPAQEMAPADEDAVNTDLGGNEPSPSESEESESAGQTNEAESAAAESESALPVNSAGEDEPASSGGTPGSEPMQLKKTTGSTYEVTFADTTFTLKQGGQTALSGTWKVIDDDKIEITSNGETIPLDVEISGSTLMVDLPVGTSFSCSSGDSDEGETIAPDTSPPNPSPSSSFEDEESDFDSTYGDYGDDTEAEVVADEGA